MQYTAVHVWAANTPDNRRAEQEGSTVEQPGGQGEGGTGRVRQAGDPG